MKILYHSAAPWTSTGYGRCTREIATRLHNSGHEVVIQPLTSLSKGSIMWYGDNMEYDLNSPMKIMPSKGTFGLANVADNFHEVDADMLFTHFDTWMRAARETIPTLEVPYASYVIVDHEPVPEAVLQQVQNSIAPITMSEWAEKCMEEQGARPYHIPHGVNTDRFKPLDDDTMENLSVQTKSVQSNEVNEKSLNDTFTVGMVAANHSDRKRIPLHMMAFKRFLDEVNDEALMYIHTEINAQQGFNLDAVRKQIGIPKENLIWPQPSDYGEVGDEFLNTWYNAFDVFVNCSQGESWGLTITEAMSAGTPCIVNNFSSMPEQVGVDPRTPESHIQWVTDGEYGSRDVGVAPNGLVVNPSLEMYRPKVSCKQKVVHNDDIFNALKYYYEHEDLRKTHGELSRKRVIENYDWDEQVVPQWIELFKHFEKEV